MFPFLLVIIFLLADVFLLGYILAVRGFSVPKLVRALSSDWYLPTQKQGSFDFITATPGPTTAPTARAEMMANAPITPKPLATGGPVSPDASVYCIDDQDPDGCDDDSAFHVPKGVGGPVANCGTIMEWTHKLVNSLPQVIKLPQGEVRDKLNPAIVNACHNTGIYLNGGYISTFFVIDAYNLAGFNGPNDLSKTNPNHVSGANMLNWWQSQTSGYKFIPYTPTVLQQHATGQQNLTGCVMFINMPSGGVHVGIVNVFEVVNQNGDGVLSILQSAASYFLDRFPVVGWDIKNAPPLHQTQITGVAGFGCR